MTIFKYPQFENTNETTTRILWSSRRSILAERSWRLSTTSSRTKDISIPLTSSTRLCLTPFKGRAPGMAFLPYCSLPELEACMEVWSFMEMIHSRSYTYVIKNVYPDPSEVFDTIIKDDRILQRASTVTESYDDFINSAQLWGTGNMWRDEFRGSPTSEWEMMDVKESYTELSLMLTFLRVSVSMLALLAVLLLVNSNL